MEKDKILSSEMADEEIEKLVTRKNSIVDEVSEKRTAFESANVETRDNILTDIEQRQAEVDQIESEITELRELKSQFEAQEERMGLMKNLETEVIEQRKGTVDPLDTPEYRSAWKNYIITTDDKEVRAILKEEARALLTTTANVPVPTLMQGYVETAWDKVGKISKLVNKTMFAGYLAIPYEASATGAVIHTEGGEEPTEETITFGQIELKAAMLKKFIVLTDELIALAPEEFMKYIADELVYQVVLALEEGIIASAVDSNGKGIVGIVGNTLTQNVDVAVGFNAINTAIAQLKTADNLTVVMNQETFFKNIMGLTDLQGRPIFTIASDNDGRPRYFVNGIRVEFSNALKAYDSGTAGTDIWAVVGDFRGYRLNLPEGEAVKTLADPYTLATQDKVRMIGRLFAAGNVVKPYHFAQLKIPA